MLPADPLAPGDDAAISIARAGWVRGTEDPWAPVIREALEATAVVVQATRPFAGPTSVFA